jgi:hypothetical protein
MLWNFAAAGLLLWLSRRYKDDLKPGALFAGWLVLAGVGRVIIEFFRPDQPKIPGLGISYSSIVAALMAITGAVMLMMRYKAINLKFAEDWEEEYQTGEKAEAQAEPEEVLEEKKTPRVRRVSTAKTATTKKAAIKTSTRAKKSQ